jgi:hypothetical protein
MKSVKTLPTYQPVLVIPEAGAKTLHMPFSLQHEANGFTPPRTARLMPNLCIKKDSANASQLISKNYVHERVHIIHDIRRLDELAPTVNFVKALV